MNFIGRSLIPFKIPDALKHVHFYMQFLSWGKDTLWNFSFRAFYEIKFQGHSIKHEILSWNTFALVFKFRCVCFSSIKKISLQRKDVFWQQKFNSIKFWYLLLIKQKRKNSKRPKRIWIKPWLKNRNDRSAYIYFQNLC